jgi:hypothetical protein
MSPPRRSEATLFVTDMEIDQSIETERLTEINRQIDRERDG